MTTKTIINSGISELYENDLWVMSFMHSVYDLFGIPRTTKECMNATDRLLYAWGMMSLVHGMQNHNDWRDLQDNLEPEDAALVFAKTYFSRTNELIITHIPIEEKESAVKL